MDGADGMATIDYAVGRSVSRSRLEGIGRVGGLTTKLPATLTVIVSGSLAGLKDQVASLAVSVEGIIGALFQTIIDRVAAPRYQRW